MPVSACARRPPGQGNSSLSGQARPRWGGLSQLALPDISGTGGALPSWHRLQPSARLAKQPARPFLLSLRRISPRRLFTKIVRRSAPPAGAAQACPTLAGAVGGAQVPAQAPTSHLHSAGGSRNCVCETALEPRDRPSVCE